MMGVGGGEEAMVGEGVVIEVVVGLEGGGGGGDVLDVSCEKLML